MCLAPTGQTAKLVLLERGVAQWAATTLTAFLFQAVLIQTVASLGKLWFLTNALFAPEVGIVLMARTSAASAQMDMFAVQAAAP
jgi:hypothetical protein